MILNFSGIKTADDLVACMKKDHCENVPENGYGYGKHKHTKTDKEAGEDNVVTCPKFDCSQCSVGESRKNSNNTKFSWLSLSNLVEQ